MTIAFSLILMNLPHFVGAVPDSVIRIIGILTMVCAVVSVFFIVRTAVKKNEEKKMKERNDVK